MGPLHGIKIIEFAALGPAPMGAMILADLGAEVVRIERKLAPGAKPASELFDPAIDILNRNRRVVTLDLKKPEGLAAARQTGRVDRGVQAVELRGLGLGQQGQGFVVIAVRALGLKAHERDEAV